VNSHRGDHSLACPGDLLALKPPSTGGVAAFDRLNQEDVLPRSGLCIETDIQTEI
jgi:hypothetical protein